MKTYLATTTLTDLTEITMNTDLSGPVRAYYVVTDEDQGSEYEVTLTYGGDYDGVSEETLNLPFTTEFGGKYYYSCTWKVLTKVSDSSPSPTPSPSPSPTSVSSTDGYILLEYSETNELILPCYTNIKLEVGITVDWDAAGTGDIEEYYYTGWTWQSEGWSSPYIQKTWADSQPRTIKITGNVDTFSAGSYSMQASQRKITSATVSGKFPSLTNTSQAFGYCENMTSLDISNFDVTNVIYASQMFYRCFGLTGELDLSHFSVAKFQSFSSMFKDCKNLTSINTTGWDTSDANSFGDMFNTCENLESLDISHWDYSSNQYNFWWMFHNCKKLITLNGYQNFPIETQVNTKYMFYGCNVLESLDLTNWEMSTVENAAGMFQNCHALNSISGISDWDFTSVTSSNNMASMFSGASDLEVLDISGWCVPNVPSEPYSFTGSAEASTYWPPFASDPSKLPAWGQACPTT